MRNRRAVSLLLWLVALAMCIAQTRANGDDEAPAADAPIAASIPASAIVTVEIPDFPTLVRDVAGHVAREEGFGESGIDERAELQEFVHDTLATLATQYLCAIEEGAASVPATRMLHAKLARTDRVGYALTDAGRAFSWWAICLRDVDGRAWVARDAAQDDAEAPGLSDKAWCDAIDRLVRRNAAITAYDIGSARVFTFAISGWLETRPRAPLADGLPELPLPDPGPRMAIAFHEHDGVRDIWLANQDDALRTILAVATGQSRPAEWRSVADLPTWKADAAPQLARGAPTWFIDGGALLDAVERTLSPRDRINYDRIGSVLDYGSIKSLGGAFDMAAAGDVATFTATMQRGPLVAGDDGDPDAVVDDGFARLAIPASSLSLVNRMPVTTLALAAVALGDEPAATWARLRSVIEPMLRAQDRERFNASLEQLEARTGMTLEEVLAPLGGTAVAALVRPAVNADADAAPRDNAPFDPSRPPWCAVVAVRDAIAAESVWERVRRSGVLGAALATESIDLDYAGTTLRLLKQPAVLDPDTGRETPIGPQSSADVIETDGPVWATVSDCLVLASSVAVARAMVDALAGRAPTLADVQDGPLMRSRSALPDAVSKLVLADVRALVDAFAPGYAETPAVRLLAAGMGVGAASIEDTLRQRAGDRATVSPIGLLAFTAPDLRANLRRAVGEARALARVDACRANLERLGQAVLEYWFNTYEFPPSLARLEELGFWSTERWGRSPIELIAMQRRRDLEDARREWELARLESYSYAAPSDTLTARLDPDADAPWAAPIHQVPIAWTTRAVWRGGHHVLMSNGQVQWMTPDALTHLRDLAADNRTLADELGR